MTSFADSEKRLIAAFGRIDAALDRFVQSSPAIDAGAAPSANGSDDRFAELQAENKALKRRLAEANEEAARLARANAALVAANAELTQGKDASEDALQAELDALKAARAAEIAALDEIMTGLEILLSRAPRASDAPFAEDVAPAAAVGDVVAFDQSEG